MTRRAGLPLGLLLSCVFGVGAGAAVPPPPPPIATLAGGNTLCGTGFAILLAREESADQYSAGHWVVNGPGQSIGIRAYALSEALQARDSLRGRQRIQRVNIPGLGSTERHRVLEWPGDRARGWAYWLPRDEGRAENQVSIASDQFEGSVADYAVIGRILTGEAQRQLCERAQ
jgi:hypothetical protein